MNTIYEKLNSLQWNFEIQNVLAKQLQNKTKYIHFRKNVKCKTWWKKK